MRLTADRDLGHRFAGRRIDDHHAQLINRTRHGQMIIPGLMAVAAPILVGILIVSTLAAYAFSRFRFQQRQNMLRSILLIQVFPNILLVVAIFLLIQQIGDVMPVVPDGFPRFLANLLGVQSGKGFIDLDTHTALILVHLGGSMGINIWLMKGFFDTIPRDIDESAIKECCRNKLSGFKRPKDVIFIHSDDMPRTPTGKILHRKLREKFRKPGSADKRET